MLSNLEIVYLKGRSQGIRACEIEEKLKLFFSEVVLQLPNQLYDSITKEFRVDEWHSKRIDSHYPTILRLYKEFKVLGGESIWVNLLKIVNINLTQPEYYHNHYYPMMFAVLGGSQEVILGNNERVNNVLRLSQNSYYIMPSPYNYHCVKPVGEYSLSITVSWGEFQDVKILKEDFPPLEDKEKLKLMETFYKKLK